MSKRFVSPCGRSGGGFTDDAFPGDPAVATIRTWERKSSVFLFSASKTKDCVPTMIMLSPPAFARNVMVPNGTGEEKPFGKPPVLISSPRTLLTLSYPGCGTASQFSPKANDVTSSRSGGKVIASRTVYCGMLDGSITTGSVNILPFCTVITLGSKMTELASAEEAAVRPTRSIKINNEFFIVGR